MVGAHRSVLGRLSAAVRNEIPIEQVRPMLQAGTGVYEEILAADQLRTELVTAGLTQATMSPAESGQLLCAWVAYALQSLADEFVGAEERTGPPPASGFLTRVTSDQVRILTGDVPAWIARARRSAADPGYDVAAEVPLPAVVPPWVRVEPCPTSHMVAMRSAASTMFERLELAMADFELTAAGRPLHELRGLVTELQTRLEAVPVQPSRGLSPRDHEATERALRDTVNRCFSLGQVLCRPRLLRGPTQPPNWLGRTQQQPPGWDMAVPYQPPPAHWSAHGSGHHGDHHGYGGHH